jgi:hypothetical protein
VITFTCLLCPDRSVDLPLVMLLGFPEYGQEHDRPLRSTPVRDPGRNIAQPDPQLPDWPLQVIGLWAAQLGALFGEHAAYFVDPLEVTVAEAVQPFADLRFELEVVQAPYPAAHAWSGYRSSSPVRPDRSMILIGRSVQDADLSGRLPDEHARSDLAGSVGMPLELPIGDRIRSRAVGR